MRGMLFDIQRGSYVDGPGVRTTVFLKGCHLACAWCHNPEGRAVGTERMWYAAKCAHCGRCAEKCRGGALAYDSATGALTYRRENCTRCGRCALFCPHDAVAICGYEASADEVFAEVVKDLPFYRTTGGGVTVSGGECLQQAGFTAALLAKCRAAGIHTAVDTAGDVPWEAFEAVLPETDLFLYDIKCITPERHRRFVGADNARILANYRRLLDRGAAVFVRVPMVPDCNANPKEFPKIAAFLHEAPPQKVELLPYHAMGENKRRALGLGEGPTFSPPAEEAMARFRDMVRDLL